MCTFFSALMHSFMCNTNKLYVLTMRKSLTISIRIDRWEFLNIKMQVTMKNIIAINILISLIILLVVDVLICCEARG